MVPSDLQPAMSVAHRVAEARARMSLAAAPKRLSADDIVRAKVAVVVGRMWEDGQKLRCRFLDGSAKQRKTAEAKAHA